MNTLSKIALLGSVPALAICAPTSATAGDTPWIGEMTTVAFNFCPRGWLEANGQTLPINDNTSLFALIGTYYGGNGRTNFAVPDLRSRTIVGAGTGTGLSRISIGERGGREIVALSYQEMPAHNHLANLHGENTADADTGNPDNATIARSTLKIYSSTSVPASDDQFKLGTVTVGYAGGGASFSVRNPLSV